MNIIHTQDKILTRPLASRWMPYGFVILFCLGLESLLLGLGWTDLGIPYLYHYDFLYNSALVKGIVDHGWYLNNPSLGAPGGLAMHDYPEVANINFLLIKLIALFTSWILIRVICEVVALLSKLTGHFALFTIGNMGITVKFHI